MIFRTLGKHSWCLVVAMSLGLLSLSGCQPNGSKTGVLNFKLRHDQQVLTCQQGFKPVISSVEHVSDWYYQQVLFFVSELSWQDQAGDWHAMELINNEFQYANLALIGESCSTSNKQSNQHNWQLQLAQPVELSKLKQVKFTLGIPFHLNHQNPLTQPSPLNVSSMFWVWRTGHKFMRVELMQGQPDAVKDDWLFHLGSTGCKAASPVRAPSNECRQPNRVEVVIAAPENGIINVNLAGLLYQLAPSRAHSCQSAPDNPYCQQLFSNIGLTAKQRVFYADN